MISGLIKSIFLINFFVALTDPKPCLSKILVTKEEGCLSIPDHFAEIKRPDACHVKYLNQNGKEKILKADGLLATCIQHEIDHCNGILFLDYLSKLKKAFITRKLIKAKKNQE